MARKRSFQKVRRNSYSPDAARAWSKPFDKSCKARFLNVLRKFEQRTRAEAKAPNKRRRYGAIGMIAIEVVAQLFEYVNPKTGQLDVSHATLAADLDRSVTAVKNALNALRNAGFLTWVRRFRPRFGGGVEQDSNWYRLLPPESLAPKPPEEDFWSKMRAARAATVARAAAKLALKREDDARREAAWSSFVAHMDAVAIQP